MSISDDEIAIKVRSIVQEQIGLPESPSEDARLVADLGADSLDLVELMMALEDEFGLYEIPNEEADKISTVGEAIACVRKYLGMKTGDSDAESVNV
jgi:acyl carrier protein